MHFSIVTPSFRNSNWLKLCIPSIADQGVSLEHIVQDSCSDDGTQEWLPHDSRVSAFIEKDGGMYDGVNRGLRRARGDVLAYLNCDEQYLPGALPAVQQLFAAHPDVDIVFADALVVDSHGQYVCHRQTLPPLVRHTVACHLGILTCATFFRRRLIERGFLFDTTYRVIGDAEWIVRLLQAGTRMAHLPVVTSVFTDLGSNLGFSERSGQEQERLRAAFPSWWSRLSKLWMIQHRLRRLMAGYYHPPGGVYSLYTRLDPARRREFAIQSPTALWKGHVGLLK